MAERIVRALRYHETGKPGEVLQLEEMACPEPGPGQALVALRASPVNPSDLGMIGGSYGRLRELPAIGGREGAGEVVAVGEGVSQVKPGDRVQMPDDGVWTEARLASAEELRKLPEDIDWPLLAQAFVNPPTAIRMLSDFVDLQPGDWLVQNAANSAVGFCVAGLARKRGLNALCVVRDAKWEQPLKDAGATAVVTEDSDYFKSIKDICEGKKPRLALNSVGGESVVRLIRSLGMGGVCVTFGGMVGDKVRFPTRSLIFDQITLTGFWMDLWFREHSSEEADTLMAEVFENLQDGTFPIPVAESYPLENGLAAVNHAAESGRKGKVLITSDWTG